MSKTNRTIVSILALCVLCGAVFLTLTLISPPAPQLADAPATDFSAGRAMQDLDVIAREPHPMGISQAHADARDYLVGEVRKLGLEPQVQDTFGLRVVNPGFVLGGAVENILVRLPGTDVGAALSHAAIVARELGIPAVVGCGDATTRLKTGDRVLADGGAGVVLLSNGREPDRQLTIDN